MGSHSVNLIGSLADEVGEFAQNKKLYKVFTHNLKRLIINHGFGNGGVERKIKKIFRRRRIVV